MKGLQSKRGKTDHSENGLVKKWKDTGQPVCSSSPGGKMVVAKYVMPIF